MMNKKTLRNRKGRRNIGRGKPSLKLNVWFTIKKEYRLSVRASCVYWDTLSDVLTRSEFATSWIKYRHMFYSNNPCFKKAKDTHHG